MSKKGIEDLKREYEEIRMSETQVEAFHKSIEKAKKDNRRKSSLRIWKNIGTVAAAVLITFIILPNTSAGVAHAMAKIPFLGNMIRVVTFRDYNYDSGTQIANVDVPKIELEETAVEDTAVAAAGLPEEGSAAYGGEESMEDGPDASALKETVNGINADIDMLTEQIIADFKKDVEEETGVKEVLVSHEVVATPETYFTLQLTHYESAADGAERIYYYTIDLETGERLELKDLFEDDADYIGIISEEIIRQMREGMIADENVHYWLDEEFEDWNFTSITEETQFYINENNNVVISFNEGDVAPMYMGVETFEISAEVLNDMWK